MVSPIPASQRLWGIALSPVGSLMAISDAMAGVIYVLDPSNPSSVKTFLIQQLSGAITTLRQLDVPKYPPLLTNPA